MLKSSIVSKTHALDRNHGGTELIGRGTSVDLSEFSERNSKYRAIFQAAE